MPKLKNVILAHKARMNPQMPGSIDIIGAFDNLIQPLFPYPMLNLSIVLTIEGITKPTKFEVRFNSPDEQLITKGEFLPIVDPFGVGKKIIDLEKIMIKDRGVYTIELFEKDGDNVKFLSSQKAFIAEYPPKRKMNEQLISEILEKDDVIKKVKTEFRPFDNPEEIIKVQISLDPSTEVEEGYVACPENNSIELDGKTYDLTGLRRQVEWMYGRPIPKNPEEKEIKEEETEGLLS